MASQTLPRNSKKRRSPWVRLIKQGFVLLASVLLIGASILGFFYFRAHQEAEEVMNDLQRRIDGVNKLTSQIVSKDGVVLFSVSSENRIPLTLPEIPKSVQNAVLAAEDKRFYKHAGVDFWSIMRSLVTDVRGRKMAQGGSTITMQLVKLLFNGNSKTIKRKMNDIAYAQVLEQRLPKDRILELYLNKVFFGEGAYGIGEAARIYFNKNIDELTIGEAAMLARCIRRPSIENPIRDLDASIENRDVVLGIMRDEKMISVDQYDKAIAEKPKVNPKLENNGVFTKPGCEYFVDHVKAFVKDDLGLDLNNGGFTIETTLDYKLQKHTLEVLEEFVRANRHLRVNQGCFVVIDSDGNILAEVGGLNYREHHQNLITQGHMQPGSGFKPILYATALKAGTINMNSMLSNAPMTVIDGAGKLKPFKNASVTENKPFYGLRTALASSINLCALHTMQEVGPDAVVQTAYDSFGFRTRLEPVIPLALGTTAVHPIEMAEAYSVFMLHGDRVRPQPVSRVTDSTGALVTQYQPQRFAGAFDPAVSDEVDELLRGVVEYGTGMEARVVPNARGKTGTTNEAKDAWFNGYADGVLGIGWVGHEVWSKEQKTWVPGVMSQAVYGGNTAAKIWAAVMKVAHEKYAKALPPSAVEAPKRKPVDAKPDADVDPDLVGSPDAGTTPITVLPNNPSKTTAAGKPAPPKTEPEPKPIVITNENPDEPPAKPDKPKKPAKTDPDSDTVTLEICQDSGLIANQYCPETVTRTFKRGREPKRKCHIHGPGG